MWSRLTKSAALFLTVWVVVLQFAGSSPHLHAFLHGEVDTAHACGEPCSGEPDSQQSDHVCTVVLLTEGIVTADALDFTPDPGGVLSILEQRLPASPESDSFHGNSARAPPVL